ncbi:MAG: hypothetical protein E7302_11480 [Butyrivibrio sp.]|nr:hypothetical protein [Butyrivibrio sp.]
MRALVKRRLPAYMSVEAAFIVPAATFAIALIIYLAFFAYARCILSQDVYILGFRASIFSKSQGYENGAEYVEDKADRQIAGRYFGCDKPQIKASEQKKKITVDGKVSLKPRGLFGYYKDIPGVFEAGERGSAKRHNAPKGLRRIKRFVDLGKKVTKKG